MHERLAVSQHSSSPKTIFDLPVELLQRIFRFLTDAEVYMNLRCVCWRFRACIEDYIQIGKGKNIPND